MFCYHITLEVKKYKVEEMLDNLNTFSDQFRSERGCQGYHIFRECDKSGSFRLVGEWQTYLAMKQHFQTDNFKILIGAIKVLCETSEVLTAETVSLSKAS